MATKEKIITSGPEPIEPVTIQTITLDITEPLKFQEMDLNFRMLTLMTGYNGAGKSFINVCCFAISQIAQAIVGGVRDEPLRLSAQWIFDTCFDYKETNGLISVRFTKDSLVRVVLEKGKVVYVYFDGFEDVKHIDKIIYMSSAMRTFTGIKSYLVSRKMVKRMVGDDMQKIIATLSEDYKLYDILYIEGLILGMPLKMNDRLKKFIDSFELKTEVEILSFDVDLEKSEFFMIEKKDGEEKQTFLSAMSAGNQSIYNISLGTILNS